MSTSEAKFKEFEPWFKFKSRLKYGWFHFKLYLIFQDISRRSLETVLGYLRRGLNSLNSDTVLFRFGMIIGKYNFLLFLISTLFHLIPPYFTLFHLIPGPVFKCIIGNPIRSSWNLFFAKISFFWNNNNKSNNNLITTNDN